MVRKSAPLRFGWLLAWAAALSTGDTAWGGGGPENVLVVVRASDGVSKTIANYYAALRGIPATNFAYLDWNGNDPRTDVDQFRAKILHPVYDAMRTNRVGGQIDCVAYSSGFPTTINIQTDLTAALKTKIQFPEASITGLTFLSQTVGQKDAAAYLHPKANRYFAWSDRGPLPSRAFRYWYGWGPEGELMESGGQRFMLSTMLGVTVGRGNTVGEIVNYLQRSATADGTFPQGAIYYMQNSDIRSTIRSPGFKTAVAELQKLGVAAQIVQGDIPRGKSDVQGLMSGVASFDWKASGSTIRPGAICENFTSFGAVFEPNTGQSCLCEFLRYGAAGSSGTVAEPYAIGQKFPDAMVQVHYARGCNLAESFYQSVSAPFQLLIVGDPLCRPWANIPTVAVQGVSDGATLSGGVAIRPSGTLPRGGTVDRFELYVDGLRAGAGSAGDAIELNTGDYSDGYHELRVVGIENSAAESQGRKIMSVHFNNHGKKIEFTAGPATVRAGRKVKLTAKSAGAVGVAFYHNGRVIAKFAGEQGQAEVDSTELGDGPVLLQAIGWGKGGSENHVIADPVQLTVEGSLSGT